MITPEQLASSGSEFGHQAALFCFFALAENKIKYPLAQRLFAIPNGFFSSSGQKGKEKAAGLKNGVPDMMLPIIRQYHSREIKYCGLFIELKVPKHKRENDPLAGTTDEQKDWIPFLITQGYAVYVAYGWKDARDIIINYLEN